MRKIKTISSVLYNTDQDFDDAVNEFLATSGIQILSVTPVMAMSKYSLTQKVFCVYQDLNFTPQCGPQ